jgi:starch-binding outer membrane protein, SusD/RagB family
MEMADGTKFDWGNPEHAAMPYKNREPRFYANILYDGAPWRPRPSELTHRDPAGILQTGSYEVWSETTNSVITKYGLDRSRSGLLFSHIATSTGYYLRKFSDPAVDLHEWQDVSYRWIRYGEVLLNYAEACIELGDFEEARTYINMVRDRAGLPGVTESGNDLRERYRKERRIELMFEDHRYFDVRRWVIGPEAYDKEVSAVNIVYELQDDKTTAEIPTVTPYKFEKWEWHDRAYFHPILRTEMLRNDILVQNPLYE